MPKEKDDISIDPKNKGKFTKWVKKNMPGKSTCAAASAVVKNKKKYKPAVVKMANYANNFGCKTKGKGKGPKAGLFGGLVAEGKKQGMSNKKAIKYAAENIEQRAKEK